MSITTSEGHCQSIFTLLCMIPLKVLYMHTMWHGRSFCRGQHHIQCTLLSCLFQVHHTAGTSCCPTCYWTTDHMSLHSAALAEQTLCLECRGHKPCAPTYRETSNTYNINWLNSCHSNIKQALTTVALTLSPYTTAEFILILMHIDTNTSLSLKLHHHWHLPIVHGLLE